MTANMSDSHNTSLLPRPPSRLPKRTPSKRILSPEQEQPTKRSRLETSVLSDTSILNTSSATNKATLKRSTSATFDRHNASSNTTKKPPPVAVSKPRSVVVPRMIVKAKKPDEPPRRSAMTRSASTTSINTVGKMGPPVSHGIPRKPSSVPMHQHTTANSTSAAGGGSCGGGAAALKKRPAWDLKGRVQDMEMLLLKKQEIGNEMKGRLESYNGRIEALEHQNQMLSGTVQQKEQQTTVATQEIHTLQRRLRDAEDDLEGMKRKYQRELEDLQFTKSSLERQKDALESELKASQQEISGLKCTVAQLTSSQSGMKAELDTTKLSLENSLKSGKEKDASIASMTSEINEYQRTFREHETERRKLHNTIQELKGNIRVFCRVRPLMEDEMVGSDGTIHHMNFPDPDQKMLEVEKLADINPNESVLSNGRRTNSKHEFEFDRVFPPTSTQVEVFDEISQLVQSALDGYNVCIFAYGQTGSGKTYTMEGPDTDNEDGMGMIPRAVLQIFNSTHELKDKGWEYELEASFLEIYNETIRDLLGSGRSDVKYEIKHTSSGVAMDVMVTNLTLVSVKSKNQVHHLLKEASENRAVAETKCNERSSRSHSVFRMKLTGHNDTTGEACQGTLNLVDLAGSERLKESGSEGVRLKETKSINSSLSNLSNVIVALGNKESHVPYRNSKLTYMLQNSLGGNSKTLMFVNVSPREECFNETLCSLRFATKVNQCNIGTATKKVK